MNFDIIPPDPINPRWRGAITKAIFLAVWIGAGGLMYIGVKEVFGETGILHALFAVVVGYGSFYAAAKVAEGFEKNQEQKDEACKRYWYAYWDKVEALEKEIKEFPEDGREYELEHMKKELKYLRSIRERYERTR